MHPGEIFGEMSYLNQSKTMASVFAMQNSDVWEISSDKL
ncbi:MAG: cyclic nucleotide-binding domain-containing protein [Patescibacteria group bacterium]